jgi:hypothetical protein
MKSASNASLEDIMRRRRAATDEHEYEYSDQSDYVYCQQSSSHDHNRKHEEAASPQASNPWANALGRSKANASNSVPDKAPQKSVRDLASAFTSRTETPSKETLVSKGTPASKSSNEGGEIAALLAARRRKVDSACGSLDFVGEVLYLTALFFAAKKIEACVQTCFSMCY